MYDVGTFAAWDYVVLAISLGISTGIGIFYGCTGTKQSTTKEFLLADRNMSPFPVSMSLIASFISAITVLGTPSEMYLYGSMFWLFSFAYIGSGLIAALFMPVFFRLSITSANEYLEMRFNKATRILGTLVFFAQMILYLGIVIYAPALALNQVTGLNLWGSVMAIGIVCTFYTTIGGMKAVLWTDAFQVMVMMSGFLAVIIKGSMNTGGLDKAWQICEENGRIDFWNFDPDPTVRHTFWTIIVGGTFTWGSTYGVNQSQVQRYLTCGKEKTAQLALFMAIIGMVIVVSAACLSGLVMYANFVDCDPFTMGYVSSSDQLMPYFVMYLFGSMPGLPGLFTSAVFSAALSTVSSGLNSLAAVTAEDIVKSIWPKIEEKKYTLVTKGLALFFGVLCIGMTYVASQLGGVLQAALSIFGMIGGPMLGLYSLGMFFPWTNSYGAIGGTLCGLVWSLWVGIGAQLYPPEVYKPPLYTDGCYNESILTTMTMGPTTMMPTEEPRPAIAPLYYLSYSWYSAAAWLQTCFWGLLISFLTGYTDPRTVNPSLISPIVDRMYCCLPESIKKPLRCGVGELYQEDEEPKEEDDTAMKVKYENAAYVNDDELPHPVNGHYKSQLNGDALPEQKFREIGTQFTSDHEDSRL
ncbi:sodium-coupled monocarboxylate transporter 1-like isoform X2 [Lytechinus variegatus]|uniref:sodium-coupled monocarboxylate transporter 1-like isoform X2 n=1 Tax=Lytechinus variegatus TaxID=7654 RepID=UPI001BB23480|nr:sodium-coupled monocarboxylate transporter 1-like isoform X2 [Lytechinus variegatus]